MQEPQIQSLGGEEPLKKGMATHSSILAWEISGTEEPGRLQSTGSQRVRHDWACTHACIVALQCYFLVSNKVNQPCVYIYPSFFRVPSHLGPHRALCAIQYVLISSYSFFISWALLKGFAGDKLFLDRPGVSKFLGLIPPWNVKS